MIRRLTRREQAIGVVCFLVVLIFVGFSIVVKPLQSLILEVETKIDILQKKIQRDLRVARKAKETEGLFEVYKEKFKQTKSDEQINSQILSEIETVAGQLNVTISDLKPKRVRKEKYYNYFSVSLTINSDLNDIVHFLYQVQSDPHFFNLEEVRFDKGSRRKSETVKTSLILNKIFVP